MALNSEAMILAGRNAVLMDPSSIRKTRILLPSPDLFCYDHQRVGTGPIGPLTDEIWLQHDELSKPNQTHMISKAINNLEAAEILHGLKAYSDSVASRAYYAAYLAGWHFLDEQGDPAPSDGGKTYWRHSKILDKLEDAGVNPHSNWQGEFELLQSQREKADYFKDSVHPNTAATVLLHAKALVEWVQNNA